MISRIVQWLWCGVIFLLPWHLVYVIRTPEIGNPSSVWQYGVLGIYALDVLIVSLIGVWLGYFFYHRRWRLWDRHVCIMIASLVMFVLWSGVSLWWSADVVVSLQACLRLVLGAVLFVIALTESFSMKMVALSWFSSAVLQAGLAWYQFFSQSVFGSRWLGVAAHNPLVFGDSVVEGVVGRWLRSYGTWPHPNMLAMFLVIGFIAAVMLFFSTKKNIESWFYFVGSAIIMIGLFVSFGRAGFVALGVSLVVTISYLMMSRRLFFDKKAILFGAAITCIVAAVVYALSSPLAIRFGISDSRLERVSLYERVILVDEAWSLIRAFPWGAGIGVSTLAMYRLDVVHGEGGALFGYQYQPVHTIYLLVIVELGFVGGVMFLWWLLRVFRYVLSCLRREVTVWRVGGLAFVMSILVVGLFDHFFWTLHGGVMMWWAALSSSVLFLRQESK